VYRKYGAPEVVQIEDAPRPVPGKQDVLVRVQATTVCAGDVRFRKAKPFFLRVLNGLARPKKIKILGMEFAGIVEETGKSVTAYKKGDPIFGSMGLKFGVHAEYACSAAGPLVAARPDNVSFEEAAAIPFGGISALHFLRLAGIRPRQNVLIYGASGSVGTFAVQLAKHFGARVTAVCSTANLELVKSLGADDIIDYTKSDFSKAGHVYDIVFDAVGKSGFWRSMRALKRGGVFVFAVSGLFAPTLGRLWTWLTGRARVPGGMARTKPGDLSFLAGLAASGKLKIVIDRRYPLEQIAEAHRHVEAGHKKGNVVITVGP
jgi:NADPH:quinone reductase-like Zn-dependent oxidoreductase